MCVQVNQLGIQCSRWQDGLWDGPCRIGRFLKILREVPSYPTTARVSLMPSPWVRTGHFNWHINTFPRTVYSWRFSVDENGTVLVFQGHHFWTVSNGSVSNRLPLQTRWPQLPLAIEAAAFSPLDSKLYFFKGKYLRSSDRYPITGNTISRAVTHVPECSFVRMVSICLPNYKTCFWGFEGWLCIQF